MKKKSTMLHAEKWIQLDMIALCGIKLREKILLFVDLRSYIDT